jgi:formylglycine-generating enzyme required for sulfatase activity
MVKIAGATFSMGSNETGLEASAPVHKVTVKGAYCIDRHEVTTAEYAACSTCKPASQTNEWQGIRPVDRALFDGMCNVRDAQKRAEHPINCVAWAQAGEYCKAQGKRLPTEAEWELAARGADGRRYPWGAEKPSHELVNACGPECVEWKLGRKMDLITGFDGDLPIFRALYPTTDGWPDTAPVGSYPKGAAPGGVEDMAGNVWEWVADWYGPFGVAPQVDPEGQKGGVLKTVRGGSWAASRYISVAAALRHGEPPLKTSFAIGFRCAKTL